SAADRAELRARLTRMLRLDETAEHVAAFHAVDGRWKADGRGRLMRSPTLFEDIIKTVTSCNVTWPGTINMNRRLCEVYGREVRRFLLSLPGVGPYAAANIMQLLGRYDHVALDSEALRHGREALGLKGTDAAVMRKVATHYAAFGEHAFRSYWLTMWVAYEAK